MLLIITDALVGAGLVLFKMVAENTSLARAFWMSGHLMNTFLLLAALAMTAWLASGGERARLSGHGILGAMFRISLVGMLILGVSGAVTALGDTLFPARSLAEGLAKYPSPTAQILLPLRILHPVIAIVVGVCLTFAALLARVRRPGAWTKRLSAALLALILIQMGAGALNVALMAPAWLQLMHLLLSDLVWIALVLLMAAAMPQASVSKEALIRSTPDAQIGKLEEALKNYPALTGSREG
jgi:heme A synthase